MFSIASDIFPTHHLVFTGLLSKEWAECGAVGGNTGGPLCPQVRTQWVPCMFRFTSECS